MSLILNVYIFCSFYMTGVIWLIQLLNYPSFFYIDAAKFIDYHRRHSQMMSFLVGPVMIVELICVLVLAKSSETFWILQAGMVLALWGFTFLVSVPIHSQLDQGQNEKLIQKLNSTNWPRTFLWTVKALIVFYFHTNKTI